MEMVAADLQALLKKLDELRLVSMQNAVTRLDIQDAENAMQRATMAELKIKALEDESATMMEQYVALEEERAEMRRRWAIQLQALEDTVLESTTVLLKSSMAIQRDSTVATSGCCGLARL